DEHGGGNVEQVRSQCHSLGVVPRTGGNHAALAFRGAEPVDPGIRTTEFERPGPLQILTLEKHITATGTTQVASMFHRCSADNVRQQVPSGRNLLAGHKPHYTRSFLVG